MDDDDEHVNNDDNKHNTTITNRDIDIEHSIEQKYELLLVSKEENIDIHSVNNYDIGMNICIYIRCVFYKYDKYYISLYIIYILYITIYV